MKTVTDQKLCSLAIEAKKFSYSPYSRFRVGAALLTTEGTVYQGCNIENAAYTPTNCAERTAFFKAISDGKKSFQAIAISGDAKEYLYPCGVCRQVMIEFCDPDTFRILLVRPDGTYKEHTLSELLPGAFTKEEMQKGVR